MFVQKKEKSYQSSTSQLGCLASSRSMSVSYFPAVLQTVPAPVKHLQRLFSKGKSGQRLLSTAIQELPASGGRETRSHLSRKGEERRKNCPEIWKGSKIWLLLTLFKETRWYNMRWQIFSRGFLYSHLKWSCYYICTGFSFSSSKSHPGSSLAVGQSWVLLLLIVLLP